MLYLKTKDTNVVIHDDGITIVTTRVIRNRINRVITMCDGTIGNAAERINSLADISNDMYEQFSRIQKEANDA